MINRGLVSPIKLLRIYKEMKRKPTKVFVMNDFFAVKDRSCFTLLLKLNLIEKVDAIYRTGVKKQYYRTVIGYRINKLNLDGGKTMGKIVLKNAVKRKTGYLYYVDGLGNVCEAAMVRSGKKKTTKKTVTKKKVKKR